MRIEFEVNAERKLNLMTESNVFLPNTTTSLLISSVKSRINSPSKILDLGCGTGAVGIALNEDKLVKQPIYASDLSEEATNCSKVNFEQYHCSADVRNGSMFEPWEGEIFDVIIDDISGISQDVANVSPWFPGVPCDTGKDGTDLVSNIIRTASDHLTDKGLLFFPVLSLSNVDSIIESANESFAVVQRLERKEWPLPEDLKEHIPMLRRLGAENSIKYDERFGMVICYTEVYCASEAR